MNVRSVLIALVLITVGIVVGALVVSNTTGEVASGVAQVDGGVKLGGPVPVQQAGLDLKAASESFVAVAKAVTPSVVSITVTSTQKGDSRMPRDFFHFFGPDFQSPGPERSQGYGSGVIITADGYIVTNNHVVAGADPGGIEVVLNDNSTQGARLIGTDPSTDLAVIKIDGKGLPAAAIANSDQVQVGEWVLAIGNPLGLTSTVTAGIVSALGRNIGIIREGTADPRVGNYNIESFIQTDAAINPGNSGGALVNIRGEVVGINTAIATTNARYQGYGFAVPSNLMRSVVADLISHGKVRRGYIGVSIRPLNAGTAQALGLDKPRGVIVEEVVQGGAAQEAGVRDGDVILTVDGREVNQANELQSYVATRRPGESVTLKIFRDGKTVERKVTLKLREEPATAEPAVEKKEAEKPAEKAPKTVSFEGLGLTVRPLTPEDKGEGGFPQAGAVIAEVTPYSEAFNRGLGPNQVIVEADKQQVASPADLKRIIGGRKPGDAVLLRVQRPEGGKFYVGLQIPKE
jgi:serine protease Do